MLFFLATVYCCFCSCWVSPQLSYRWCTWCQVICWQVTEEGKGSRLLGALFLYHLCNTGLCWQMAYYTFTGVPRERTEVWGKVVKTHSKQVKTSSRYGFFFSQMVSTLLSWFLEGNDVWWILKWLCRWCMQVWWCGTKKRQLLYPDMDVDLTIFHTGVLYRSKDVACLGTLVDSPAG